MSMTLIYVGATCFDRIPRIRWGNLSLYINLAIHEIPYFVYTHCILAPPIERWVGLVCRVVMYGE